MSVWDAMGELGWRYDVHSNGFRNADGLWVSFAQAEAALSDAEAGIDRSKPANDECG